MPLLEEVYYIALHRSILTGMNTPYFRKGAGSVIYKEDGQVLVFKRTGENIWQFQQGGMDEGEEPEQTLWRELEEETALIKDDFIKIHPYPTPTIYHYPIEMILPARYINCLGQTHRWWFLEIASGTEIDLNKASDKEFEDYHWIPFTEYLLTTNSSFKHSVYNELFDYFRNNILNKEN